MFNPAAPGVGGWFMPTGGAYAPTPRQEPTELSPAAPADPDAARWAAYEARLLAALQGASGWNRIKLEAEIKDARLARENAMEIAKLNSRTSRYGVDQQSKSRLAELQQNQSQFEANHSLEMQRFGLDTAKAYTEFASTPDRYFQAADFMSMANRQQQGLGPTPYMSEGQPTPKVWNDFAALAGWGNNPQVSAGMSGGATAAAAAAGGGATGAGADGIAGTGDDPRVKLLGNLVKTLPPSQGEGLDGNDFAVLQAARQIMSTNLRPGDLAKMRPGQKAMLGSAIKRSGAYLPDWEAQQTRNLPGQGSPRAA